MKRSYPADDRSVDSQQKVCCSSVSTRITPKRQPTLNDVQSALVATPMVQRASAPRPNARAIAAPAAADVGSRPSLRATSRAKSARSAPPAESAAVAAEPKRFSAIHARRMIVCGRSTPPSSQ
ncbi:MAG: hypothetical protein U0575_03420 [Phycisphaerales bacterium]